MYLFLEFRPFCRFTEGIFARGNISSLFVTAETAIEEGRGETVQKPLKMPRTDQRGGTEDHTTEPTNSGAIPAQSRKSRIQVR